MIERKWTMITCCKTSSSVSLPVNSPTIRGGVHALDVANGSDVLLFDVCCCIARPAKPKKRNKCKCFIYNFKYNSCKRDTSKTSLWNIHQPAVNCSINSLSGDVRFRLFVIIVDVLLNDIDELGMGECCGVISCIAIRLTPFVVRRFVGCVDDDDVACIK